MKIKKQLYDIVKVVLMIRRILRDFRVQSESNFTNSFFRKNFNMIKFCNHSCWKFKKHWMRNRFIVNAKILTNVHTKIWLAWTRVGFIFTATGNDSYFNRKFQDLEFNPIWKQFNILYKIIISNFQKLIFKIWCF